jgi:integrase
MATIYRKSYKVPIPPGAEVVNRKSGPAARWTDTRGRTRTEPLSEDGTRIIIERPEWFIDYTGPDGRRHTVKGFRDKVATEAEARRLERNSERAAVGLPVADHAAKARVHYTAALETWIADLRRLGSDDEYVKNMQRLVGKLARECGWTTLAAIRGDQVSSWMSEVKSKGMIDRWGRRKKTPPSDRTVNQYLESAKCFLNWCVAQSPPYLEANPLDGIKKARRFKRVRVRRAVSEAELLALLAVAGPRRPVYRVALLTGLRKDELRQLEWRDVRFDSPKPHIQLRVEANKARRPDRIPLAPAVVADFRAMQRTEPTERVFAAVPTLKQFRRDLRAARIEYRNAEGKQFDFHSLRYCFCTMLAKAGVPIRTAIELMRHRDPKLTLMIYTDAGQLDTDEAVGRLPNLEITDKRHGQRAVGKSETKA